MEHCRELCGTLPVERVTPKRNVPQTCRPACLASASPCCEGDVAQGPRLAFQRPIPAGGYNGKGWDEVREVQRLTNLNQSKTYDYYISTVYNIQWRYDMYKHIYIYIYVCVVVIMYILYMSIFVCVCLYLFIKHGRQALPSSLFASSRIQMK